MYQSQIFTKTFGEETLSSSLWLQRVNCQDVVVGESPMTRDKGGQHGAVLRQVTAGVVVKLTVLHDYVGLCLMKISNIFIRWSSDHSLTNNDGNNTWLTVHSVSTYCP